MTFREFYMPLTTEEKTQIKLKLQKYAGESSIYAWLSETRRPSRLLEEKVCEIIGRKVSFPLKKKSNHRVTHG